MSPADLAQFFVVSELPECPRGYGLLHCRDEAGDKWTMATDDPDYQRILVELNGTESLAGLRIPEDKYSGARQGWPDDWAAEYRRN